MMLTIFSVAVSFSLFSSLVSDEDRERRRQQHSKVSAMERYTGVQVRGRHYSQKAVTMAFSLVEGSFKDLWHN